MISKNLASLLSSPCLILSLLRKQGQSWAVLIWLCQISWPEIFLILTETESWNKKIVSHWIAILWITVHIYIHYQSNMGAKQYSKQLLKQRKAVWVISHFLVNCIISYVFIHCSDAFSENINSNNKWKVVSKTDIMYISTTYVYVYSRLQYFAFGASPWPTS